jgi:S1-C subfamily serine protease
MSVKLKVTLALALVFLVGSLPLSAQDVERRLERVAVNADFAVLPVWYSPPGNPAPMQVVGTAFLVTPDGYFITAAHVLHEYKPKSPQMTVGLRQRSGDMGGAWFDLIEKDEPHDLALCKITSALEKFVAR